jgi:hypothetical protein
MAIIQQRKLSKKLSPKNAHSITKLFKKVTKFLSVGFVY